MVCSNQMREGWRQKVIKSKGGKEGEGEEIDGKKLQDVKGKRRGE